MGRLRATGSWWSSWVCRVGFMVAVGVGVDAKVQVWFGDVSSDLGDAGLELYGLGDFVPSGSELGFGDSQWQGARWFRSCFLLLWVSYLRRREVESDRGMEDLGGFFSFVCFLCGSSGEKKTGGGRRSSGDGREAWE